MGNILEEIQPDNDDLEHANEKEFEDNLPVGSDSDSDSEENSEYDDIWDHGDELDNFSFEEELGYADTLTITYTVRSTTTNTQKPEGSAECVTAV
jgi:hypothetical protein